MYPYKPQTAFHPGETLREKLEETGMSAKEFAIRTGKPEKTISAVINGKSSVTPEMAVLFENVLKIPASFWLRKQKRYDEYLARQKQKQELEKAKDWARQFPYTEMAKRGWVKATRKAEEKLSELLKFFNVGKKTAWEAIYLKAELPLFFRMSLKHNKNPYAVSALLRYGEIVAKKIQVEEFDKNKLEETIPTLKKIMIDEPQDMLCQIKETLKTTGVKIVFTQHLSGSPVNGVVRWLDDRPVILMTDRYKKYDIFWFSLFHEIGHILLHGKKKNIFLESTDTREKTKEETEADNFAAQILLDDESFEHIRTILETEKNIEAVFEYYANKYQTHRDIIVGRFLKENKNQKYKYLYGTIKEVDFKQSDKVFKI